MTLKYAERPRTRTTTHEVVCQPGPFQFILSGARTADYRSDQDFHAGEVLRIRECLGSPGTYTNRELRALITDVVRGPDCNIPAGYCVLSIKRM